MQSHEGLQKIQAAVSAKVHRGLVIAARVAFWLTQIEIRVDNRTDVSHRLVGVALH
jgi:hypothetical protein